MEISDAEEAIEDVVFARKRPSGDTASSAGAGMGTESTINCPLRKAFARKCLTSSRPLSEKSAGPSVLRASCRAAIVTPCALLAQDVEYQQRLR